MKKIECLLSDEKNKTIDTLCDKECYTRAEFNRRAIENYLKLLEDAGVITKTNNK